MAAIRLVVGLGNPGPRYVGTPHNVGAEFVEALAARFGIRLAEDSRFKGRIGRGMVVNHDVRVLVPLTFMNVSGESVGAVATFYKYSAAELLVVHDEMAFEPGVIRLKLGGGHNGHNGLRDIISALGNESGFARLRIGVGHPGDREKVSGFLTSTRMPTEQRKKVAEACELPDTLLDLICAGEFAKAMNQLHAAGNGES
jgi:peptidyl-tRNA hydrolase, PTH1 family